MIFSKVIFYSLDTTRLATFIQEIFDSEIYPKGDSILLHSEQLDFEIQETLVKGKKDAYRHSQALEFTVEKHEQLEEIRKKIEFFCYRQDLKLEDLILNSEKHILLIEDPDGRNWRFSVDKA